MYELLLPLITAHLLADFPLQSDREVERKHDLEVLARHLFVVAAVSWLLVGDWRLWTVPLMVLVAHGIIDVVKTHTADPDSLVGFVADQGAHLASLGLVAWLVPALGFPAPSPLPPMLGSFYTDALVLVSGTVTTVWVAGILVELTLKPVQAQLDLEGRGLVAGGRRIGWLERALILVFVLAGQMTGVGFLVAAKSIFRFGELSDSSRRKEAEYIIIGTLTSFLFGLVLALLTRWSLGAL